MYHGLPTGLTCIAARNRPHWLPEVVHSSIDRLLNANWPGELPHPVVHAHRIGHEEFNRDLDARDAEADVLAAIRERAGELHEELVHEHGVFAVEFVGSTGGGKTRLIEELLERAPADERIGAIVGDVAGADDATRLRKYDIPVENINTGKECHLDPDGVGTALSRFDLDVLDTLYVENVGNMVCPADFPLGASLRILVVSTTEGDDVVSKHPLLVQAVDAVVINKVDLAAAVGTDLDRVRRDIKRAAPQVPIFETNARDGEGVDDLATYLRSHRQAQGAHTASQEFDGTAARAGQADSNASQVHSDHGHEHRSPKPNRMPHRHSGEDNDVE